MGPNPMNAGYVFLEETRRKYNLLMVEVEKFQRNYIKYVILSCLIFTITGIFVSYAAFVAMAVANVCCAIFVLRLAPMKGINQAQFEEAFYGDTYHFAEVNVEEVFTWLENAEKSRGIMICLNQFMPWYFLGTSIGTALTLIFSVFILGGK